MPYAAQSAGEREPRARNEEAKPTSLGYALMENRHRLLVDRQVTRATGTAEQDVVPTLLDDARDRGVRPRALGTDKNHDTAACVAAQRVRGVTPHVAQNTAAPPSRRTCPTTCATSAVDAAREA